MLQARRVSTTGAYSSPWNKWVLWCKQRKVDAISCPVTHVLDYLTRSFCQGLQYRTIGVHRSAISAYHSPVGNIPIGKHQDMCTLMTGVDNLRPPTTKHCTIWEVETVVKCLKEMRDDSNLSNKDLTFKTAMLLALTAMKRASKLHILDVRYMAVGEDRVRFQLAERPKHIRKRRGRPDPIKYLASEKTFCPVTTIKACTASWRENNLESRLFLSFVKPNKAVTTSTITLWLKEVLRTVGVGTTVFTGHSIRSASSSKAFAKGASIQDILKCGNWSRVSTWQYFYHKSISQDVAQVQHSLLV